MRNYNPSEINIHTKIPAIDMSQANNCYLSKISSNEYNLIKPFLALIYFDKITFKNKEYIATNVNFRQSTMNYKKNAFDTIYLLHLNDNITCQNKG